MASTTKFQFNPILSGKFVWNIGILWTTHNSLASRQKIFDRENFNLYTKYNTHFVLANTNTNITHTIEYSSFCSSLFDFFSAAFYANRHKLDTYKFMIDSINIRETRIRSFCGVFIYTLQVYSLRWLFTLAHSLLQQNTRKSYFEIEVAYQTYTYKRERKYRHTHTQRNWWNKNNNLNNSKDQEHKNVCCDK